MGTRIRRTSMAMGAFALAATAVAGAAPPADEAPPFDTEAVLAALVAEALSANPDVLAAAEAAAAGRARPAQARALADPVVSVALTNDGWAPSLGAMPMSTLAIMGSQSLPWPGTRGLRERVAAAGVAETEQRLVRARLGVTAAVETVYWSLALGRETLLLLDEQLGLWQGAEAAARARYAVGEGAAQDVLRAQLEITRLAQRRIEQEAELEVRAAELQRLLGRAEDAPLPPTGRLSLRSRTLELAALLADAEARSPELRAAAASIEREQWAVRLARRAFRPELTVQAGYMNRGGLDPMWQAGVGVTLPLFRERRRAAVTEAEAREREARRAEQSIRAQLRYRTRERVARIRAAEAQVRLFEEGLVPQARLAGEAALAGYQAGGASFLAVLEAFDRLLADRIALVSLVAAHEQLHSALRELSLDASMAVPAAGDRAMAALGTPMISPDQQAGDAPAGVAPSAAMAMGK